MRVTGTAAALLGLMLLTTAGCQKQAQRTVDDSAPTRTAALQSAGPSSTSPQKTASVFVNATSSAGPQPAPASASQEAPQSGSRLDLPQSEESVALQGPARAALETALSGTVGTSPLQLPDQAGAVLIDNLPQEFRDGCAEMMASWGVQAQGTAKWTVWVLFSVRRSEETAAVLSLRCETPGEQDYDERPAIVVLTPGAATLNLIPLAKQQYGESTLYRLSFAQAFRAIGAQLVELRAHHSTDNPCCGGPDTESGNRLITLDLSRGKLVLTVDESTDVDNDDDSVQDGDTHILCNTKIDYLHDTVGNVVGISTETPCKENDKPLPEIRRQNFRWNAERHVFDEVK